MPRKSKADKFLAALNGYRSTYALTKLKELRDYRFVNSLGTKSDLEVRLEHQLMDLIQCDMEDLNKLLIDFERTIDYANWDASFVYPKSDFVAGRPTLQNSHDMPTKIFDNYIMSMHELVRACDTDLTPLGPYMQNKGVLDFGCGAGAYVMPIAAQNPRKVWLYDRPSVMSRMTFTPPNFFCIESKEGLSKIGEFVETVWLSLVLHTKPNIREFMRDEVLPYAPPSACILVNSLRTDNDGYQRFFDLQTLAHCGCMWNSQTNVINSMESLGYSRVYTCNTSEITKASAFCIEN